jgi:hypothetical protein
MLQTSVPRLSSPHRQGMLKAGKYASGNITKQLTVTRKLFLVCQNMFRNVLFAEI